MFWANVLTESGGWLMIAGLAVTAAGGVTFLAGLMVAQ